MSADQPFLLVIDPNPEAGARVNSLLRNAGINIHVLHADNLGESARLIGDFKPYLIYYAAGHEAGFTVEQLVTLGRDAGTFVAIAIDHEKAPLLAQAAQTAACFGIGDEEQLIALTRRLAGIGQAAREQDRLKAQEAELEDRLDLLLNSTSEPIAYFHEGLHVAANDAYLDFMGVDHFDDLAMVSLLEILEKDDADLKALVRGFSRDEYPAAGEAFRLRPPNGEPQAVDLTFAPVRYDGEDCVQLVVRAGDAQGATDTAAIAPTTPEPVHEARPEAELEAEPKVEPEAASQSAQEVTEPATQAAAPAPVPAETAASAASTPAGNLDLDPLTGTYRRAPFMARLNQRLGNLPAHERGGVYFLRADSAAAQLEELSVRDMDRYVESIANEILSCVSERDDVCRFDDASFIIFALRSDKTALKQLGEKMRTGIERHAQAHPGEPVPPSCSIGMVLLDPQQHEAEHTLENARAACRLAAREGNALIRYKPARAAGLSDDEEAHWRERLRYAIDNEDFFTVQHSIMNLEGDLEGLTENRTFLHEEDNDVPAAEYLPAAESNQLASQVDRLTVPGLLRAVAGGADRQIIDISGNSLQDFSFPAWFQRTLQETRVPGQRIVLQCPAWAAKQQTRAAKRLIEELASQGVQFSVSGFDHDPKTLELIDALPLQFVTLDRSLTEDLQGHPTHLDAIREIVRATEAKEVLTIASDVRTSGDLAMLWRGGIKLVSGQFIQETPRVIGQ